MILIRLMMGVLFTIVQTHAAAPQKHHSMDLFNALKHRNGISLEELQRRVQEGADAKAVKTYDYDMADSALHYAIERKCSSPFLLYLIEECGVNVNDRNNAKATPCHYAAEKDRGDLIRIFFNKGADVNAKDVIRNTPLHVACSRGASNAVNALLDCGANLEAKNMGGCTPLDMARNAKHESVVKIIEDFENILEIKEPDVD
jgi:ankyrin repeat protein